VDIKKKVLKISLVVMLSFFFIIFYYFFNPLQESFFPKCIIKSCTGFYCTGCGSQRAIHQLLHLNILKALQYNAFLTLTFPFLLVLVYNLIYNFIFDTKKRIMILYNNTFVISFFSLMLLFTILRNIPYYPFSLLAPH